MKKNTKELVEKELKEVKRSASTRKTKIVAKKDASKKETTALKSTTPKKKNENKKETIIQKVDLNSQKDKAEKKQTPSKKKVTKQTKTKKVVKKAAAKKDLKPKTKTSLKVEKKQVAKLSEEKTAKNSSLTAKQEVVSKKLKVLFVASECQPFIATGGLGDVIGSLPKEIAKNSEMDIRVALPLYKNIKETYINKLEFIGNFTTHLAWRQEYCGIFKLNQDGVIYYFIDNERYFNREKPYGFYDDGERFAYFCKSIVEGLPTMDFFPDIIHCNDWQSALVSSYIKTGNWQDLRYYNIKNIYTIHNVEYQGIYGMENLGDLFGIDYKFKNFVEYNGDINLTKAAIQFSDKFTTVSESYCDNLKESYCSGGLNYIIIRNDSKLCGIMNGIDYDFYNPKTDKYIYYNYDANDIEGKLKNKTSLQKELNLKVDKDIPLIAVVSRLVSHKGIGLLTKVLDTVVEKDVQLVVVGTGDIRYIDYFNGLQARHQDKVRVFVDRYYGDMARKAYASSDLFLMPSKIEPCGISQMIASRYGSIPIVREVGGLKDSIKDFGCEGGGNGYTFTNYNPNDLYYQICKALEDYKNKDLFKQRVKKVMQQDFSWKNSAKKYIDLYKSLVR